MIERQETKDSRKNSIKNAYECLKKDANNFKQYHSCSPFNYFDIRLFYHKIITLSKNKNNVNPSS